MTEWIASCAVYVVFISTDCQCEVTCDIHIKPTLLIRGVSKHLIEDMIVTCNLMSPRSSQSLWLPLTSILIGRFSEHCRATQHMFGGMLAPTQSYIKGLFTYYVSQKQGFLHPPSPLRQQWSAFAIPPPPPPAADVICEQPLRAPV